MPNNDLTTTFRGRIAAATETLDGPMSASTLYAPGFSINVADPQWAGGAVGDARWVTDGAMANGSKIFTSATAQFTSSESQNFKVVLVAGAGVAGGLLSSTIASVQSPTQVTLRDAASTTVSGANACIGTDDYTALQTAISYQQANGGVIDLVQGRKYLTLQSLTPAPGTIGAWTTATRDCVIRMNGATIVAGQNMSASGIFGYGRLASLPVTARLLMCDGTLDGNYLGIGGGVIPQPTINAGALLALNAPYTSSAASAPNGRFNQFERMRFYRPSGYVAQGLAGHEFQACAFDSTGQPDLASGATHYDNLGGAAGYCIVNGCSWSDSSGNYSDMVSAVGTDLIRLIFVCNVSRNHQIGGIYSCGNGSIIMGNRLSNNVAGSGIGYDAGTAAGARAKNMVMGNVLDNIQVAASGLSYTTYGDLVSGNIAQDQAGWQMNGPLLLGNGFAGGNNPRIESDGTAIYIQANASTGGNIYVRPVAGSNRGGLIGLYNAGVTQWQTYDDAGVIRNTLDDGVGGMAAKGQVRLGRQTPTEAVLVSGVDTTLGPLVSVTLTAARLVGAPLTPAIGQRLTFILTQGGAGGFAVTWNAVFKKTWADTGNTTGKVSSISFVYDGTNWIQDSAQAPYV